MQPWLRDDNLPELSGNGEDLELGFKIRKVFVGWFNGEIKRAWMESSGHCKATLPDVKQRFSLLKSFATAIRTSPNKMQARWWVERRGWNFETYFDEYVRRRMEKKNQRAQAHLRRDQNNVVSAQPQ